MGVDTNETVSGALCRVNGRRAPVCLGRGNRAAPKGAPEAFWRLATQGLRPGLSSCCPSRTAAWRKSEDNRILPLTRLESHKQIPLRGGQIERQEPTPVLPIDGA